MTTSRSLALHRMSFWSEKKSYTITK